jgi:hypothetical protein
MLVIACEDEERGTEAGTGAGAGAEVTDLGVRYVQETAYVYLLLILSRNLPDLSNRQQDRVGQRSRWSMPRLRRDISAPSPVRLTLCPNNKAHAPREPRQDQAQPRSVIRECSA